MSWIVCQIGAREHYAIPRALHGAGQLAALVTDFWQEPGSVIGRLPGMRRLRDRWHPDLAGIRVIAPNLRMLGFEGAQRLRQRSGWPRTIARNALFQRAALRALSGLPKADCSPTTLFSYSYAARDLFRHAKNRGWRTVLGQIDPGPEEERIVAEERQRYPDIASRWVPTPAGYWESWKEEVELADEIIVNSEWSRECLRREGVASGKMRVVPLVYGGGSGGQDAGDGGRETRDAGEVSNSPPPTAHRPLKLLFLGQINLRKGVARLLDAMRLLKDEPIELTLAGPSEFDPSTWADLPKVRWVGPVPRSEVGDYYRAADLFILPTLSDGYALTQLESLDHGLPVLASKHCGAAVRHGENGWLLENLEPETIATALRRIRNEQLPDVTPPMFGMDDLANELLEQ